MDDTIDHVAEFLKRVFPDSRTDFYAIADVIVTKFRLTGMNSEGIKKLFPVERVAKSSGPSPHRAEDEQLGG